jgi:beta-galactosidase
VANDHYTYGPDPLRHQELSFSGDRMRGISAGGPWMLMEHAAGAASWHAINQAKKPGELLRHALAHVARGSDSVMYFQWRASRSGTEQFHSAMLPHAGRSSRIFGDITTLGGHLASLAEVAGSTVTGAQVALLHDNEAGWALKSGLKPTNNPVYADTARAIHGALFERAVTVDVLPTWHDLAGYKVVIVPGLFLVSPENARAVAEFAENGGAVVVTWFSGIVDERNTVITGGYPGAFRDLLGAWSEEFYPLTPEESVDLDNGWRGIRSSELMHADGAEVITRYSSGDVAGYPAVTRRSLDGGGSAWYLSTDLDPASLAEFLDRVLTEAGVTPAAQVSPGVEAVRRASATGSYLFLLNHAATDGWADATGVDLLSGTHHRAPVPLPAGGVVVLREE